MNRVLVVAALSMFAVLPSRAQNLDHLPQASFEAAISGDTVPLTIRFGDMDKSWRRMQISGSDDDLLSQIYSSNARNPQPQIFYTRGQTLTINDESFIVTYKITQIVETPPISDRFSNNTLQTLPVLTTNTEMELALLNPRLISRFTAVRVLDVTQEIAQNAVLIQKVREQRTKTINASSLNNLQQIGQQLRSYTQSTGKLPPLQTSAAAQKALRRFGYSSPSPFVHPETGKPYGTNATLSNRVFSRLVNPSNIVAFYEIEVSGDGTRGVSYADGSAARVPFEQSDKETTVIERASFTPPRVAPEQPTTRLQGAAALAYIFNNRKTGTPQLYRAVATGLIYYRDTTTKEPIFVAPPANFIVVPSAQAASYQKYAGYSGRKTGQAFGGYSF